MAVILLSCECNDVKALFQCNYFGEEALGRDWVKNVLGLSQSLRCSLGNKRAIGTYFPSRPDLFSLKKNEEIRGSEEQI